MISRYPCPGTEFDCAQGPPPPDCPPTLTAWIVLLLLTTMLVMLPWILDATKGAPDVPPR
jgi:hypothetical protein